VILILHCIFAFILSLIITPAARKLRILDKPNYRKIHDRPIPKGGGIGIFIPVLLLEAVAFLFFRTYVTLDIFKYLAMILSSTSV
jgi:UDP-GlcNAc:undecaprenyl-phosphate GlcNAc-1-phosphate transferase